MMKLIIIILAFVPFVLFAQTAERQVIGSAGGFGSKANIQVSSTVGETVTATGTSASVILTQGFQQADIVNVAGIDEPTLGFKMQAYPNPAKNIVILDFTADRTLQVEMAMFDVQGKSFPMQESKLSISGNVKHTIALSAMAAGNYIIKLMTADGKLNNSIKIQKVD